MTVMGVVLPLVLRLALAAIGASLNWAVYVYGAALFSSQSNLRIANHWTIPGSRS